MSTWVWAGTIFFLGNLINIFYITVLYHRGLAHGAVKLGPFSKWLVKHTGVWITGIDPKAWTCMHRHHHMYSDTDRDPHSPNRFGIFGVAVGQLRSYEETLRRLIKRDKKYTKIVKDIDFDVSYLNRNKIWWLPTLFHIAISVGLFFAFNSVLVGAAYYVGIMSHPVHGWMVNSLAHRFGYRNYDTDDNSTNNQLVSWLVFGEGLQNNHHAFPKSANFAKKRGEVDLGYLLCRIAAGFRLVRMN